MELYKFYVENWCKNRKVQALSICSFHMAIKKIKISLFHPKKDQCEMCNKSNGDKTEYLEHIKRKSEARDEKK